MPFVKLDCGMLNSTLWDDDAGRTVFITALLMAEPREFTEPVQQINVRNLELTGWSAPAGWYGFVPAAGPGIVRRAGIDADRGLEALERLGSPDPESRSKDHDGRRLIRVNGGYLILNYQTYRDRDYTAADRMQRYRERKRNVTAVTPSRRNVTRNVTQGEVEVEVEVKREEISESIREIGDRWNELAKEWGRRQITDARLRRLAPTLRRCESDLRREDATFTWIEFFARIRQQAPFLREEFAGFDLGWLAATKRGELNALKVWHMFYKASQKKTVALGRPVLVPLGGQK